MSYEWFCGDLWSSVLIVIAPSSFKTEGFNLFVYLFLALFVSLKIEFGGIIWWTKTKIYGEHTMILWDIAWALSINDCSLLFVISTFLSTALFFIYLFIFWILTPTFSSDARNLNSIYTFNTYLMHKTIRWINQICEEYSLQKNSSQKNKWIDMYYNW